MSANVMATAAGFTPDVTYPMFHAKAVILEYRYLLLYIISVDLVKAFSQNPCSYLPSLNKHAHMHIYALVARLRSADCRPMAAGNRLFCSPQSMQGLAG